VAPFPSYSRAIVNNFLTLFPSRNLGDGVAKMESVLVLPKTLRSQLPASAQQSDPEILGRIAQGDKLAMRILFARHNTRVYRFVLRLVGNEALAEDLVN
jgi:hypothetical protein